TENAEARVYFEEGNRLYTEASQAPEAQRTVLLQRALGAYVDRLRIVRSRNALFNAAIVLGELARYDEAFNYFTEYLQVEGLSLRDREEAVRRRDALRPEIAVLQVHTRPEGALLWIDRKDLAPRGETPIELALPEGEHRLFLEKQGYLPLEHTETAVRGQTVVAELALSPLPVEALPPPVEPNTVPAEPVARLKPHLRNAAIGTAAATLAAAGLALGLSLRGRTLRDDYDNAAEQYQMSGDPADLQRAEYLADRTDRFNVAADVFWGAMIGLGVSALVLYGVHRGKQKRHAPEVGLSLSREGGFASVRMPWGAAE
ncbi:MAG: PEGA domain-containing protein, partial [Polyangiales bacterium]